MGGLAGGTYPNLRGVPTLAREVLYLAGGIWLYMEYLLWQGGYLPLWGGTYLGWRGTYLGQGVPTLTWGGVSTLAMGVPSLVGAVLTLTGGTYLSWGSYLCLNRVSTLVKGMYLPWCFQKIFLFGSMWWSWKNFFGRVCLACQMSKYLKLSKRCQVVKKMSNVKSQTPGLWRRFTKKINSHNEVHTYWCQFWR